MRERRKYQVFFALVLASPFACGGRQYFEGHERVSAELVRSPTPTGRETKSQRVSDTDPWCLALSSSQAEGPPEDGVVREPFRLEYKCAENVEWKSARKIPPPADAFITHARAISEQTWSRLTSRGKFEVTFDGGIVWTEPVELVGIWGMELDDLGRLWAFGYHGAWVSRDAREWKFVALPVTGAGVSSYEEIVVRGNELWLSNINEKQLIRVLEDSPPESWEILAIPVLEIVYDVDATESGFVAFGVDEKEDLMSVDFSNGCYSVTKLGRGVAGGLDCTGNSCAAMVNGEIAVRSRPGQPWTTFGSPLEISRWHSENCAQTDVGPAASIISQSRYDELYTVRDLAFDGHSVAVSSGTSRDNGRYDAVSLVLGKEGARVLWFGHTGVWAKRRGQFWFFGPSLHAVQVSEDTEPR